MARAAETELVCLASLRGLQRTRSEAAETPGVALMATSTAQDEAFLKAVVPKALLEEAVSWIQDNLEPYEVFTEARLTEWASGALEPDDVFTTAQLRAWAVENGFAEEV